MHVDHRVARPRTFTICGAAEPTRTRTTNCEVTSTLHAFVDDYEIDHGLRLRVLTTFDDRAHSPTVCELIRCMVFSPNGHKYVTVQRAVLYGSPDDRTSPAFLTHGHKRGHPTTEQVLEDLVLAQHVPAVVESLLRDLNTLEPTILH